MQYRWAQKRKPLDTQAITSKGARSSRKRNLGKNKYFIYHDKGHFAKVYPKSRKSKREAQTSEKTMVSQF